MQLNWPPNFIQQLEMVLAEETSACLAAMADPPATFLRINPAKVAFQTNPHPVAWCSQGYTLAQRPIFPLDPWFHAGAYYVQEASSMFLGHLFQGLFPAEAPLRILDLCAAPGGKATQLASLLNPQSLLVANETVRGRAQILAENLARWGQQAQVLVTQNDPRDFRDLKGYFDLILVDAPCSGEGLFRRDPETLKQWSPQAVDLCVGRQRRILEDILPALKPGGYLIYATCTFNRQENEDNLDWLEQRGDFIPYEMPVPPEWGLRSGRGSYRFFPHLTSGEGLFFGLMQKAGESSPTRLPKSERKNLNKSLQNMALAWLNPQKSWQILMPEAELLAVPADLAGDFSYLSRYLKPLSHGITLGKPLKDTLIPAANLAFTNDLVAPASQALSWEEAQAYLYRDPLDLNLPSGWYLASYQHLALGWFKHLGDRLNNYYPQNWKIRQRFLPEQLKMTRQICQTWPFQAL